MHGPEMRDRRYLFSIQMLKCGYGFPQKELSAMAGLMGVIGCGCQVPVPMGSTGSAEGAVGLIPVEISARRQVGAQTPCFCVFVPRLVLLNHGAVPGRPARVPVMIVMSHSSYLENRRRITIGKRKEICNGILDVADSRPWV